MTIDKEVCLNILEKHLAGQTYQLIDWKEEPFRNDIGFHGKHFKLIVKVKINNRETELKFFVKTALDESSILEYFKKIRCFEKEYYMYKDVLKVLEETIDEKITPKCYANELNKYIVLENLGDKEYKFCDDKFAERDHMVCTVRKLANFHASSLILQEKTGMTMQENFPQIAFETWMTDTEGSPFLALNKVVKHMVEKRLDDIPKGTKNDFLKWMMAVMLDRIKPSSKYKNILGHGNVWFMNYLYKYNETGQVDDVLLVDFQSSRICPPACELQQLTAIRYPYDTIISKGQNVINEYYDQITKTLKKYNLDIRKVLPRSELEESFEYYRVVGVGAKVLYTILIFLPPQVLQTIDTPEKLLKLLSVGDHELCLEAFDNNETYKQHCTHAIMALYKEYCCYNRTK